MIFYRSGKEFIEEIIVTAPDGLTLFVENNVNINVLHSEDAEEVLEDWIQMRLKHIFLLLREEID